ncbi:hypothetical protein LNN31_08260 [Acetobacterium wieringae]|uniref:FlgN protein n=1 Tax=Acetobacterium wieringae TaxID=52694 RepID=A0ABY6HIN2_9FIRM|nr:hypothetical protein [Acetobacterium wieringae]UYO64401.1 hypothetical protein LNN31_08260 [Acetobacterium wieringae]VUZ25225.1 Uncharacterised protein [Acetobacterium wieringae]
MDELNIMQTHEQIEELSRIIKEKQFIIQDLLKENEKHNTKLFVIDQEINRLFNKLRVIDPKNDEFLFRLLEEQINYFSASQLCSELIEKFNKADRRLYQLIYNLQILENDMIKIKTDFTHPVREVNERKLENGTIKRTVI